MVENATVQLFKKLIAVNGESTIQLNPSDIHQISIAILEIVNCESLHFTLKNRSIFQAGHFPWPAQARPQKNQSKAQIQPHQPGH